MRVFLDANVVVSGIAFRGNEHELLKASLDPRHAFGVSADVLREVRAVFARKFPGSRADVETFLGLLPLTVLPERAYANRRTPPGVRVDAADRHVILAALAFGADVLATGDRGILACGSIGRLAILRPRETLLRVRRV